MRQKFLLHLFPTKYLSPLPLQTFLRTTWKSTPQTPLHLLTSDRPPSLFSSHLSELLHIRGKGQETEVVTLQVSHLVPLGLEFPCWLDFAHKKHRLLISTGCSLILSAHFPRSQQIPHCCVTLTPKGHRVAQNIRDVH